MRRARRCAARPASRCSSLRLAITMRAPRRANSVAMALPEAGAAAGDEHGGAVEGAGGQGASAPSSGGSGRPGATERRSWSAPGVRRGSRSSARAARSSAMSSDRLMKVWAIELLGHRRPHLRLGEVAEHPAGHLHGDRRRRGDLRRPSPWRCRRELSAATTAGHDAVGQRLVGRHRPAGEHHVGGDAVAAHLEQAGDAAGVGDDAVADLGEHEAGALGGDADVAQQRPLERGADRPPLDGDDASARRGRRAAGCRGARAASARGG